MKGYVVCVYKSIGDEKLLKKYAESAIPAIEKYEGKILVRGGKKLSIEGKEISDLLFFAKNLRNSASNSESDILAKC